MSWEPSFPHTLSCFRWEGKSAPCYAILTRHGNHPALGFNLKKKKFFLTEIKKKSYCPPTPSLKFQRQPRSTFSWYLPPDVVPTLTTALPGETFSDAALSETTPSFSSVSLPCCLVLCRTFYFLTLLYSCMRL